MSENAADVLKSCFEEATNKLLEFYSGGSIRLFEPETASIKRPWAHFECANMNESELNAASINLASPDFACQLRLLAQEQVLRTLNSGELESPQDWIGELANQLAGRFKNLLCHYEVEVRLATPVRLPINEFGSLKSAEVEKFVIAKTQYGDLALVSQIKVDPSLTWPKRVDDATATEGSLMMF